MFMWLADQVVYQLLGLTPDNPISESVHFFIMDVTKIIF